MKVDRDTIIDFIFDTLPHEETSLAANAILSDEGVKKIYEEEKDKILLCNYINNELTTHERIEFELKLKSDQQLANKLKFQKELNTSIECLTLNELLDNIHNLYISKEINSRYCPNKYIEPKVISKLNRKKWFVAAVIAILLSSGVGFERYHYRSNHSLEYRLYAKYYEPFNQNTERYVLNETALDDAMKSYMHGDYKNAFLQFQNLPSSLSIITERHMFTALSLMELGDYNEAIHNFELVLENKTHIEIVPQIQWYLALCYLKNENKAKAIVLFQSIVDAKNFNHKKAKRILKKLS